MPFSFLPQRGSYKDTKTGRFVSEADILAEMNAQIALSQIEMTTLVDQLYDKQISIQKFETSLRILLKNLYGSIAPIGAGGVSVMNPSRWGFIGSLLKKQFNFLTSFISDLIRGRYSEGQRQLVKNRLHLYAQSVRNAYYKNKVRTLKEYNPGKQIEKRKILNQGSQNCEDCLREVGLGWVDVDSDMVSDPGSGETICITNCTCDMKYRIL